MYAIIAGDPGYCATICKHECKLKDINNDILLDYFKTSSKILVKLWSRITISNAGVWKKKLPAGVLRCLGTR